MFFHTIDQNSKNSKNNNNNDNNITNDTDDINNKQRYVEFRIEWPVWYLPVSCPKVCCFLFLCLSLVNFSAFEAFLLLSSSKNVLALIAYYYPAFEAFPFSFSSKMLKFRRDIPVYCAFDASRYECRQRIPMSLRQWCEFRQTWVDTRSLTSCVHGSVARVLQ